MNISYKGNDINISFTNANVLEAVSNADNIVKDFEKSTTLPDIATHIRAVGKEIETIITESDKDFAAIFPKPDFRDYLEFLNIVNKSFNKSDFSEIKLSDIT